MTTMRRAARDGVQTSAPVLGALGQGENWAELAADAGARYGVDPAVILSVIQVESSGNPAATGAAGEIGLMQVMPATAQLVRPGITPAELRDPATNVDVGARYLADQLARYGGDLERALSAYNAGTATPRNQSYVDRVFEALASLGGPWGVEEDRGGAGATTSWWDRAGVWVRDHPVAAAAGALLGVWLIGRR